MDFSFQYFYEVFGDEREHGGYFGFWNIIVTEITSTLNEQNKMRFFRNIHLSVVHLLKHLPVEYLFEIRRR